MSQDSPGSQRNASSSEVPLERARSLPGPLLRQLTHSSRKKRRRPRRYLVVPDTEEDLANLEDAYSDYDYDYDYDCNHDGHGMQKKKKRRWDDSSLPMVDTLASSSQQIRRRPLAPNQILMSMMHEAVDTRTNANANTTTSTGTGTGTTTTANGASGSRTSGPSLLMKKFYESIGMKDHLSVADTNKDAATADSPKQTQQATDEIDDPSFSTIKIGHHKRYLNLTKNSQQQQQQQQNARQNHSQQKELKKLRAIIFEEQASYRLALDKFHHRYASRYLIGVGAGPSNGTKNANAAAAAAAAAKKNEDANAFCRWACSRAQSINREWKKTLAVEDGDREQPDDEASGRSDREDNGDVLRPLPNRYGRVRQTLGVAPRAHQMLLDVQDLTCSVVHESRPVPLLRPSPSSSSSSSSSPTPPALPPRVPEFSPDAVRADTDGGASPKVPPPAKEFAPRVRLLRDDAKALELAARHSAAIVTTSETLETLLRLPGHYSSAWMLLCTKIRIPKTSNSNSNSNSKSSTDFSVTILDLPIGQAFSSPRACLETGFREGLYQLFQQAQRQRTSHDQATTDTAAEKTAGTQTKATAPPSTQFFYSLWTLPSKSVGGNVSKNPTRVIIRTLVRLKDSVSKVPVRLRARAEYFHTPVNATGRSHREIPNSYEKSLWILDQILFGHQAFCLQYRIDPTTCKILGWDTTSIAHAFAESSSQSSRSPNEESGPLDHWKALIRMLRSIPAIDCPDALLCLPGLVGERETLANDNIDTETGFSRAEQIDGLGGEPSNAPETRQQGRFDPLSVSVHASCDDDDDDDDDGGTTNSQSQSQSQSRSTPACSAATIRLDSGIFDRAGTVRLGQRALLDCRRDWEWDVPGRVPNTFPVMDSIEQPL